MRIKFAIVISIVLWILSSTEIFASKARLRALGQDDENSSFYIHDERSVFRNSATLNLEKDYCLMEWGKSSPNLTDNNPNAEGGFFIEGGDFVFGVYLGSEHRSNNATKLSHEFMAQENRIDVFFAGDAGTKWGIRTYYSNGIDEITSYKKEYAAVDLGLGIIRDDTTVYLNIDLEDEAKGGKSSEGDTWDADLGINFGGSFSPTTGTTLFADYDQTGYRMVVNGSVTDIEKKQYLVGIGRSYEISNTSRIYGDFEISYLDWERKRVYSLPLTVAVESKVYSWLILRGSIEQQLYNRTKVGGLQQSSTDSTIVKAGATFIFERFKVDGLIGTTGRSRQSTIDPDEPEGVLATDNLMTSVSLLYKF